MFKNQKIYIAKTTQKLTLGGGLMDIWKELEKLNEEKETGFIKAEQVGKARTGGSSNVQKTKEFLVEGFFKMCMKDGKIIKNWFNIPYHMLVQVTANDPKVAINNKYFLNTIKGAFTIYNSTHSETAKNHIKDIEHEINSKLSNSNIIVTLKNIHFRKHGQTVKIIYDVEIKTKQEKQNEQKSEQKPQTQNKTQNIKPQK